MKGFAKIVLATLFVSLVFTLQGCGCDEGAAKKCGKPTCKEQTGCLNDAGCCDYEQDGAKMKELMKAACTLQGAASGDNKCA